MEYLQGEVVVVCQVGVHNKLWAVRLDDCGRALRAEHMRQIGSHLQGNAGLFSSIVVRS